MSKPIKFTGASAPIWSCSAGGRIQAGCDWTCRNKDCTALKGEHSCCLALCRQSLPIPELGRPVSAQTWLRHIMVKESRWAERCVHSQIRLTWLFSHLLRTHQLQVV